MSSIMLSATKSKINLSLQQLANVVWLQKRFSQHPKRFYKNVTISQTNGIFEVNLDNRKLKTPMGKVFQVPSEPLALAIAGEWNSQETHILRSNMHLTNLSNTALDNPTHQTKDTLVNSIIEFLPTDTVCFTQEEPVALAELQASEWRPILDWFCDRYNVHIEVSSSIVGPTITQQTKDNMKRHLLSYDFWCLTGMNSAVELLKSVVLMMSVVDCHLSIEKAVSLSRLEVEFQIANWGNVEWAHDIELMDLRTRTAAAVMFVHFNRQEFMKKISKSKSISSNMNFT